MRILLALDGSHGAETAHALVTNLPWPPAVHIDAIRVIEPVFDLLAMPAVEFDGSIEELVGVDGVRHALEADAADLATPTRTVETHVVLGRPATVIIETAERLRSELIVMGSRGRGPIGTMVLGSVSAEVADHAPCPVLVARAPTCRRAIVALDGTPMTDRIIDTVASFPFLRDTELHVVSVAPPSAPGPGVMLSGVYGMPIAWYEEGIEAAHRSLEAVASAGAKRLRAAGLTAVWTVDEGDPAAKLIDVARDTDADLIIVGTHGRTGMTRFLLGSVARNVLLHAHASVLVLRAPRATGHDADVHAAAGMTG